MEPVTLVDAENVRRSAWPNIGRDDLVGLVRAWADAVGAKVVPVFDGPSRQTEDGKHLRVVGTGDESADDWIARAAERLARERRPYRLVTSDRGLRARAAGHADDVVGGGTFAQTLLAVPTGSAPGTPETASSLRSRATSGPSAPSSRVERAAPA